MENFVLYEDVGRGDHCVVYKGRRKGTINFVAINCIEKCKRHLITNTVRLIHEINHGNIVKFYEWYETSNHLWMIVELCTGGSLKTVIEQDQHLPESCIRKFGIDLVNGLHHIHSLGIIYCDLKPSNILLDGPGDLKYADFGLSRMDGENINELFEQFSETGEQFTNVETETNKSSRGGQNTSRTAAYMAPELFQGSDPSISSDLWSLGCILFEMFAGHPPFVADNFEELRDKILKKEPPPPKVKGSRVSAKPSSEFQSLVEGLLVKDPSRRMDWGALVVHEFWQNSLQQLAQDLEAPADIRESLRQSVANFTSGVVTENRPMTAVDYGGLRSGSDQPDSGLVFDETRPDSAASFRPRSALGNTEGQVLFTLSSRPHTAVLADDPSVDEHLTTTVSPQRLLTSATGRDARLTLAPGDEVDDDVTCGAVTSLIYHSSDFTVSPIVENSKKQGSLKFDPKTLSVPPYSAEKLVAMSRKEQERHLAAIVENLSIQERGPPSPKHVQLLSYVGSLGANRMLADLLVSQDVLVILARQVKETQQIELKSKLCRVVGVIAANVTELNVSTNIAESISLLTELLREARSSKVKLAVLPAVGELLCLVNNQEYSRGGGLVERWTVPAATYGLISRCLRETEEGTVSHVAARIIENVAAKAGSHAQKFATNEVGNMLWNSFSLASPDVVRTTAISALCRISRLVPAVFQTLLEKVGLPKMLSAMSQPVNRIQQAIVTMFVALMAADIRQMRFAQDKEFINQIFRLLESPSVIIRAKAFLALQQIISCSHDMLFAACENRLVMYVERDSRKQVLGKVENVGQLEYLSKCLELLTATMVDSAPRVSKDILSALDAVSGRKHPSTIQVKQLKSCLHHTQILRHFVTSSILRPKIVDQKFMKNLALFVGHVQSLDSGATQIQSATGVGGTDDFVHIVFAIIEAVVQHATIVTEFCVVFIDQILPLLASLIFSNSGDTSTVSLRLLSEIACIFLTHEMSETPQHQLQIKKLHQLVLDSLLPKYEFILLQPDPLPSYGLKLLLALIEQHPPFIRDVERHGLVPVFFQVLEDHRSNPITSAVKQIVGILSCLVTRKETNMKELYEQGFVGQLTFLFLETCRLCLSAETSDSKSLAMLLVSLLETTHGALRIVSDIVRRALEARKAGRGDGVSRETEEAEELLLLHKPLAQFISPLTQLLIHEDSDVADMSLKVLSLLVQLYGAETSGTLSVANLESYSSVLKSTDGKKQKVILRILKRILSADTGHIELVRQHGSALADTIRSLVHAASTNADVALSGLAADILKMTGHRV